MDPLRFDMLVKTLSAAGTRRVLLRLLAAVPVAGGVFSLFEEEGVAGNGHKGEGKGNKGGKGGKGGKSKGGKGKGGKHKCGKHKCGANQLCADGTCQACTVTCVSGDPARCGEDLQKAMNGGGTVYVCPGRYQRTFTIDTSLTLIGAGTGAKAAANTILDAQGAGGVVRINGGVGTVTLEQLRITGGHTAGDGGGIFHQGTALLMTDCTVTGNAADFSGGGIYNQGILELTRCTISDNHAPTLYGGGIQVGQIAVVTDCLIENNSAALDGGAFFITDSHLARLTLKGSTVVRGNRADRGAGVSLEIGALHVEAPSRVTGNTATTSGGGIFTGPAFGGPVILDAGSLVCGNSPDQCVGFPDPNGTCQASCRP
jgi:hypothetical protein